MTSSQQDILIRISDAAGARERYFMRATGATWSAAYEADWRVAAEIHELAASPARDIQFLGPRYIRRP